MKNLYKEILIELLYRGITPSPLFFKVANSEHDMSFLDDDRSWIRRKFGRVIFLIKEIPSSIYSYFSNKVHKFRHGYSYEELWSLDYTMNKFIIPKLKGFRDNFANGNICGVPGILIEDEDKEDISEESDLWLSYLNEMVWAFEFGAADWNMYADEWAWVRYANGMRLFADHYLHLWW